MRPVVRSPLRTPAQRDAAVYGVVDSRLWGDEAERKPNAFARFSVSHSDRNEVDRYADAGLVLTEILSKRPDDDVGLAFAVARI